MSHTGRNWWAILGTDQTISQDRGDIKTLTWASPILLTVKSHTQHEIMTIYILSNTKSRALRQGREGGSEETPGSFLHFSKSQTLSVAWKQQFLSFSQTPELTLRNRQLMTHNNEMSVHKRTIHAHDSVNTSKARAEILNQCLKAFRLFMHNLTPTTALDVHCIFREDKRAGGWKCWIQSLSGRWWSTGGGGSLSDQAPLWTKHTRRKCKNLPSHTLQDFFFSNQLHMRNLILHAKGQFVLSAVFVL